MRFYQGKKRERKFRHCYKPSWLSFPYAAPAAERHLLKLEDARGFSPCDGLSNRILVLHLAILLSTGGDPPFLNLMNQMATKVNYTMNSGRRSLILSSCQNVRWLFSLNLQSFPSSRWFPSDPMIGRIVLKGARDLTSEGSRYPHIYKNSVADHVSGRIGLKIIALTYSPRTKCGELISNQKIFIS